MTVVPDLKIARPPPLPPPRGDKFACIAHPPDLPLFRSYMHFLKPEKTFRDELILKLFEWTPAFKVKDLRDVSIDGRIYLDGNILMVPFLPEMREIKLKEIIGKIEQAIAIAAGEGCAIAALGGFTSIVLQGQEQALSEKHRIKLTSGNTLTAAIIIRSITELCERFSIPLASQTLAIVGATGDIGSGCAQYFCDKVKKLILTARGSMPLTALSTTLAPLASCEIAASTDNRDAVESGSIVIFVTSAYTTLFNVNDFKPGTIVCDASAPQNVQFDGNLGGDVLLYHGGIAEIPTAIDPGFDIGLATANTFYGCQLEGMFIAQNPSLPCSWGRGNISREKIALYLQAMDRNPLVRPAFTIRERRYNDRDLEFFSKKLRAIRV
jgi:fatty aldehyde-generating acyl-ACP reductase